MSGTLIPDIIIFRLELGKIIYSVTVCRIKIFVSWCLCASFSTNKDSYLELLGAKLNF